MAMETQEQTLENDKEEYEEEGEVDLEAELISALSDLRTKRKKNKFLKEELIKLKEGSQNPNKNFEEVQQIMIIINLKVRLEEAKVIEKILKRRKGKNKQVFGN
jgi:hypothetical protein